MLAMSTASAANKLLSQINEENKQSFILHKGILMHQMQSGTT